MPLKDDPRRTDAASIIIRSNARYGYPLKRMCETYPAHHLNTKARLGVVFITCRFRAGDSCFILGWGRLSVSFY